MIYIMQSEEWK